MVQVKQVKAVLPKCLIQDRAKLEKRLKGLFKRRRHPEKVERTLEKLYSEAEASCRLREKRASAFSEIPYPSELPIVRKKDEILEAILKHQVVVVAGETGSGKTTQIPKICLEAGRGVAGRVGCTQPRRVAATSISRRIAEELKVSWGKEVGCKVRFQDQTVPETSVKMMTDGMLLAELQQDSDLLEYDTIIVDEAHERSLNIDFLLGHLRRLLARRPELKVIITSATIDTESFSEAFGKAPIIEVSGRLFPVEVYYSPLDEGSEEAGDVTYIDAAVDHVERIVRETGEGDLLVFMPSERDIGETREQLEGRKLKGVEIIPLFGRLSASDQQRVFQTSAARKVVIATNIAETSLTIPGIRYVIDPGLARVSRYNPRTRTHRLPIEPVAQSSADQRKGRSGRMENGVCIRLFSEEDYLERPRYTQPEIQRANLAEVILRMHASGLGDIETFPFLNPPSAQAIRSGYQLLQELGALDADRRLTRLGRDLARLPIDPAIGRMVLQARREGALHEVVVIAGGLSIQDPRERPMDRQQEADEAHKGFVDSRSDFLTLLNIWNAFHEKWETFRTQNQLRKFCRAHFLSYVRMREWTDIYNQLRETLEEMAMWSEQKTAAGYAAIHRAILSGLLGHIAEKREKNRYTAAGNRQVMLFPGSGLFDGNSEGRKKGSKASSKEASASASSSNPPWIVAGEIVETTRLYARTVAGIEPNWAIELGAHLCRFKYEEPHWSAKARRVLARERTMLFGLQVRSRWVAYGKVNPEEATEMFIQSALVEEQMPETYPFLEHNRQMREKIENYQTRLRHVALPDLYRALFEFYAARIEGISSLDGLNRLLRERRQEDPEFLYARESDLIGEQSLDYDGEAFPDWVTVGERKVPLSYAYAPGGEKDGVTVKLPFDLAAHVTPATLEWAVPAFREVKIAHLLRSLPKSYRRELVPIPQRAKEIAGRLRPTRGKLTEALSAHLYEQYGLDVPPSAWQPEAVPDHLWTRVEVIGRNDKPISAGRDLEALTAELESREEPVDESSWGRVAAQWERYDLTSWSFGDLPEHIEVATDADLPIYAYPGLDVEQGTVNLRLFKRRDDALEASREGFQRLCERALSKDLGWLQKDLRSLQKLKLLYAPLGSVEGLQMAAFEHLKAYLFGNEDVFPLQQAKFEAALERARSRLPGLAARFYDLLKEILEWGQKLESASTSYPGMKEDLKYLLPSDFLSRVPYEVLVHYPRYLKAMSIRAERAKTNPPKDQKKAKQVQPYLESLDRLKRCDLKTRKARRARAELAWMIEEYKVSCFAPELGTAYPISSARLDQTIEAI